MLDLNNRDLAKDSVESLVEQIQLASPSAASASQSEGKSLVAASLLLQSGLRALLPVGEREGIASPQILENDLDDVKIAQRNYAEVFAGAQTANPEQTAVALRALRQAASEFGRLGYIDAARGVHAYADALDWPTPSNGFHSWYSEWTENIERAHSQDRSITIDATEPSGSPPKKRPIAHTL